VKRCLLAAGLLAVLAVAFPLASGSAPTRQVPSVTAFKIDARPAATADTNGDKVFDTLAARLETLTATDRLSVIVRVNGDLTAERAGALEQAVGGFELTRWLPIVDGFAATMTKSQVEALAGRKAIL
jgi:hypothetical protein